MNRLRFLRFLFVLFIVLTVIFGIGLIVPENRGNTLGRIGLWCGFIAMLVDAVVMFTEGEPCRASDALHILIKQGMRDPKPALSQDLFFL